MDSFPEVKDDEVVESHHGLAFYRPWFVDEANVGDNAGFCEVVFKTFYNCLPRLARGEIPFVRLDVKTLMQWFRVIFSTHALIAVDDVRYQSGVK